MPQSRAGQIKHWVFDLDGTLTQPIHDFDGIKQTLGIPVYEDILRYIGQQSSDKKQSLMKQLDQLEAQLAQQNTLQAGADQLLEALTQRGCCLAILTRNSRDNAIISLDNIGLLSYFDQNALLGRMQACAKPDPDGLYQLSEYWNVPPDQLAMVGDYHYDLLCGRACGAMTVYFNGAKRERHPELTDIYLEQLTQLMDYF